MPADAVDAFVIQMDAMAAGIGGKDLDAVLAKAGVEAKEQAAKAVQSEGSRKGSLADQSMSNWRRGSPFKIGARYDIQGTTVSVTPERRASGPWRVLEEGRASGGSFDMVLVGRARKDGTRRGRSRGRNQGGTAGKSTWSDAEKLIEAKVPPVAVETAWELVRKRWG